MGVSQFHCSVILNRYSHPSENAKIGIMSLCTIGGRVALIASLAVLASCERSPRSPAAPSLPSRGPTPFEGVWRLDYRMTECSGERHCVLHIGQIRQVLLRLSRTGTTFDGVVTVFSYTVDVTGSLSADGELVLSGRRPSAISGDREMVIRTLRLRPSITGLSGSIEYVLHGPPYSNIFGDVRHAGDITNAVRVPLDSAFDPTQFRGTWKGQFVVRDCSFVGWLWCYPHEADRVHSFTLVLTQIGTEVTGELTILPSTIPVTGTVSGSTLELRGSASRVISGGTEDVRITSWSTRRDIVGRMTGTFGFTVEWPGIGDGTRLYSTSYRRVELVSTALAN